MKDPRRLTGATRTLSEKEAHFKGHEPGPSNPGHIPGVLIGSATTLAVLATVAATGPDVANWAQNTYNNMQVASQYPHIGAAFAVLAGAAGTAIGVTALLERKGSKTHGLLQKSGLSADDLGLINNAWKTVVKTNHGLAERVESRKDWIKASSAQFPDVSKEMLKAHGIETRNPAALLDLQNAYTYGLKSALIEKSKEAGGAFKPVSEAALNKSIAQGMVAYYEAKNDPSSVADKIKQIFTGKQAEGVDPYRLTKAALATVETLQRRDNRLVDEGLSY